MKKTALIISAFGLVFLLASCNTIKEIPDDKTYAQIIQMGQNASAATSYKSAIVCYETAIERFGTNPAYFAEAKYEIGYVYLKQKKYDKAYANFSELLELYEALGSTIPASYKRLAEIGMEKIPERYKKQS